RVSQDILRANPFAVSGNLLQAEILLAQKDEKGARRLLEQVREQPVITPANRARLADLLHRAGASKAALADYRALLEPQFDQPSLWSGYISAAAAAPSLSKKDDELILRIAKEATATSKDSLFLARLGWVLHRLERPEQSRQALERALALK